MKKIISFLVINTLIFSFSTMADVKDSKELAKLLVKLEKKARKVIAGKLGMAKGDNKQFMIKSTILPAAIAGPIFADVVPEVTQGKAWVKMFVGENPRNPKNTGDKTSFTILKELQKGAPFVEKETKEAYYYAEPITAVTGCLECHGTPKGDPDPYFPEYKQDGWKVGDVVGGVISKVKK